MSKTPQQMGKDFEQVLRDVLEGYVAKNKVSYIRLYDTTSAQGYLPAQPGDFVATYRGKSNLIETKSSSKYNTMVNNRGVLTSNFSENQMACHRIWKRSGANCLIIFLSNDDQEVELFCGKEVADAYFEPRAKLEQSQLLAKFPKSEMAKFLLPFLE